MSKRPSSETQNKRIREMIKKNPYHGHKVIAKQLRAKYGVGADRRTINKVKQQMATEAKVAAIASAPPGSYVKMADRVRLNEPYVPQSSKPTFTKAAPGYGKRLTLALALVLLMLAIAGATYGVYTVSMAHGLLLMPGLQVTPTTGISVLT